MKKSIKIILSVIMVVVLLFCFSGCTEKAKREYVDFKSNVNGGLERTVRVYTANGDIIAEYSGKIDIENNAGGYVKFDFDGKRYIYYNCFVETIADI